MQNGGTTKGLGREDFARAWAYGDEWERGRMIYDLGQEGYEAKQMVKRMWAGIAVLVVIGAPILMSALNVIGD